MEGISETQSNTAIVKLACRRVRLTRWPRERLLCFRFCFFFLGCVCESLVREDAWVCPPLFKATTKKYDARARAETFNPRGETRHHLISLSFCVREKEREVLCTNKTPRYLKERKENKQDGSHTQPSITTPPCLRSGRSRLFTKLHKNINLKKKKQNAATLLKLG